MRSARRVSAACAATLPVAVLLTGCVSTQTIARACPPGRRADPAGAEPTEVTRANPEVSVGGLW